MGTQSDGIVYFGQQHSWTSQLAHLANVIYTVPLIQGPGCNPPVVPPLQFNIRLNSASAAAPSTSCAPNFPRITLPLNNVALDGATAKFAYTWTPESAVVRAINRAGGQFYSRVLPPGQTQVTAMASQNPTFVSVELGANELLGALSGLLLPNESFTPADTFFRYMDLIIESVKGTGAKAVLAGLPADLSSFAALRTGAELAADSAAFSGLHVTVGADCRTMNQNNFIFVPSRVLGFLALGRAAAAAGQPRPVMDCADVPFNGSNLAAAQDAVLTPADLAVLNAQIAAMNAHLQQLADANGYAFFTLGALYDAPNLAKPPFSALALLGSNTPYGPNISLDGVHPSDAGHTILANAAATAINANYGFSIPQASMPSPLLVVDER